MKNLSDNNKMALGMLAVILIVAILLAIGLYLGGFAISDAIFGGLLCAVTGVSTIGMLVSIMMMFIDC